MKGSLGPSVPEASLRRLPQDHSYLVKLQAQGDHRNFLQRHRSGLALCSGAST
jgi:hypothetical protein